MPADKGRPARKATMRDVAALSGVSVMTVSRVVNGQPGVSPELTARVLEAMRLLGYRHDLRASSLRRADRKTATIGLLLEDVANPFSSALHRAIEDVARDRQTLVFAGSSDEDGDRAQDFLRALVSRRVDGLIIVPASRDNGELVTELRSGIPAVIVDRAVQQLDVDTVTADNHGGAREAVEHLCAHGHRRIGFLGDLSAIWTARERYRGYVEGLARANLPLDPALVHRDVHSEEAAARAVHAMLTSGDPPTALFTGQNLITIGAVRALRQLGLQHRVALVGFDDFTLADLLDPAVTVVAQDPAKMGRIAADLLFSRLDGERGPARHVVLPTRLVPRGSGEIPPG